MNIIPVISSTISEVGGSNADHVLMVLPTLNGPTEFHSYTDYNDFERKFGTHFRLLKDCTEEEEDEYSRILSNSIKYLLDSRIPILCSAVDSEVRASVRIYYLNGRLNVCSISHRGNHEYDENLIRLDEFTKDILESDKSTGTLVHSLPLNGVINELGSEVIGGTSFDETSEWYITLPIVDRIDHLRTDEEKAEIPEKIHLPYFIALENDQYNWSDSSLFPFVNPIYNNKLDRKVFTLKCSGLVSEIEDSIMNLNRALEDYYQENLKEGYEYTRWFCRLDKKNNQILFFSDHYIYASGINSTYGNGYEFSPDSDYSGYLMDMMTSENKIMDIHSKFRGSIGNDTTITFDKTDKGVFVKVFHGTEWVDQIQLYEPNENHSWTYDEEFIKIEQWYPNIVNDDGELIYPDLESFASDSFFTSPDTKNILLSGGYDITDFTTDDLISKSLDFLDLEEDYKVDFIFDCMIPNWEFHEGILHKLIPNDQIELYKTKNRNMTLLADGNLCTRQSIEESNNKVLFYEPTPALLPEINYEISLGALIIKQLNSYNFCPVVPIVIKEDYQSKLDALRDSKLLKSNPEYYEKYFGKDRLTEIERILSEYPSELDLGNLNCPEVDNGLVVFESLKLCDLNVEESIDWILSSFIHNECRRVFEPFIGEYLLNDTKRSDLINDTFQLFKIAPSIITSYNVINSKATNSSLNIEVIVEREKLSGGVKKFYININL